MSAIDGFAISRPNNLLPPGIKVCQYFGPVQNQRDFGQGFSLYPCILILLIGRLILQRKLNFAQHCIHSIQGVDTDHFRGIINAGCTESSVRISADSGAPSEYRVLPISQRFDIQIQGDPKRL